MKLLKRVFGVALFIAAWPALHIYLRKGQRARVLLACGDKILVVKGLPSDGRWTLPGGGIKSDEEPLAAVVREVYEETNIVIVADSLKLLYVDRYKQNGLRYTYHCFAGSIDKELPPFRRQREITDAQWVDYHELTSRTAGHDVMKAVATWFAN